jgi:type II secretory pathway pseudopilin PulG
MNDSVIPASRLVEGENRLRERHCAAASGGPRRRAPRAQGGYVLLVILLMLSLMALAMTAALPAIKGQIQREREEESIYRAKQYATAVKRFYYKYKAYPPNLDALKETEGLHFLRQAWPDPLTKSGKWRFIHVAEGMTGAAPGTGPNGPLGAPGGGIGGFGNGPGAPGAAGQFGLGMSGPSGNNRAFGGPSSMSAGAGAATADGLSSGESSADNSDNSTESADTGDGARGDGQKKKKDPNCRDPKAPEPTHSAFGENVGGGPILGVASYDGEIAFHEFKNKKRPCEWRWVYDPTKDKSAFGGAGGAPAGANSGTTGVGGLGVGGPNAFPGMQPLNLGNGSGSDDSGSGSDSGQGSGSNSGSGTGSGSGGGTSGNSGGSGQPPT